MAAREPWPLVNDWGLIYRISKGNLRKLLEARAAGEDVSPACFGGRCIGQVTLTLTDMDAGEAQMHLDNL